MGHKSIRLKTCKKVVHMCGLKSSVPGHRNINVWEVFGPIRDEQQWSESKWEKVFRDRERKFRCNMCKNGMQNNCRLVRCKNKEIPRRESMYEGSYGSELLFKARSQTFEA